ncbi:MAG: DUF3558 domain-containing protein [Haloechinothrix sp.]
MRSKTRHARVTTALLAGLASAALIVGCSDDSTNGTPQPAGGQPPQTAQQPDSALPHSGAPKVTDPIETAAFEADPCGVVTEVQLKSMGMTLDEFEPELDFPAGPKCDWLLHPVRAGSFGGAFLTANPEGLSNFYAKDKADEWGYFEEVDPIKGYPAVVVALNDPPGEGFCNLEVGLRDDLAFSVGVSGSWEESPLYDDPCGVAQKLAELVIKNMKGSA